MKKIINNIKNLLCIISSLVIISAYTQDIQAKVKTSKSSKKTSKSSSKNTKSTKKVSSTKTAKPTQIKVTAATTTHRLIDFIESETNRLYNKHDQLAQSITSLIEKASIQDTIQKLSVLSLEIKDLYTREKQAFDDANEVYQSEKRVFDKYKDRGMSSTVIRSQQQKTNNALAQRNTHSSWDEYKVADHIIDTFVEDIITKKETTEEDILKKTAKIYDDNFSKLTINTEKLIEDVQKIVDRLTDEASDQDLVPVYIASVKKQLNNAQKALNRLVEINLAENKLQEQIKIIELSHKDIESSLKETTNTINNLRPKEIVLATKEQKQKNRTDEIALQEKITAHLGELGTIKESITHMAEQEKIAGTAHAKKLLDQGQALQDSLDKNIHTVSNLLDEVKQEISIKNEVALSLNQIEQAQKLLARLEQETTMQEQESTLNQIRTLVTQAQATKENAQTLIKESPIVQKEVDQLVSKAQNSITKAQPEITQAQDIINKTLQKSAQDIAQETQQRIQQEALTLAQEKQRFIDDILQTIDDRLQNINEKSKNFVNLPTTWAGDTAAKVKIIQDYSEQNNLFAPEAIDPIINKITDLLTISTKLLTDIRAQADQPETQKIIDTIKDNITKLTNKKSDFIAQLDESKKQFKEQRKKLNISRLSVSGACIECDLEGVEFNGSCGSSLPKPDLRRARLKNSRFNSAQCQYANFAGAHLEGAQFKSTDLTGAKFYDFDVSYAQGSGPAVVTGADFSPLGNSGKPTQLIGANFYNVDLTGANLQSVHAWSTPEKSTQFQYALLKNTNLGNARFGVSDEIRKKITDNPDDTSWADISTSMQNVDLSGASINNTDFTNANLDHANLDHVKGSDNNFSFAGLVDVNFQDSILKNALFKRNKLIRAQFNNSDLTHAQFLSTDLTKADFTSAILSDAVFCSESVSIQGKNTNVTNPTSIKKTIFRKAQLDNARFVNIIDEDTAFFGSTKINTFVLLAHTVWWQANYIGLGGEVSSCQAPDKNSTIKENTCDSPGHLVNNKDLGKDVMMCPPEEEVDAAELKKKISSKINF